ncbi:MAG: hypothetical protein R3F65_17315 [bacterium]
MEWILLDRGGAGGRRLDAIRIADGATRCLIAHPQGGGYAIAPDPSGRRVAATLVDEVAGGRAATRCALVDLDRGALRWLAASLDPAWTFDRVAFSDDGRRLVASGRHGPALAADVYVFAIDPDHPLDAEGQALVAGAGNPDRMGLRCPRFAPGGRQVFYLQRGAGDLYTVVVLDVEKPGEGPDVLGGRAPSARTLALTEPLRIAPDAGLAYCHTRRQLYFAHLLAGRQRLARKPLTGQAPRTFWRAHPAIDAICADPEGAGVVYAAEGQLFWADLELDDVLVLAEAAKGVDGDRLACAAGGWVFYLRAGEAGEELCAIHRPSRSEQVVWRGEGPVAGFALAPAEMSARLAALGAGPLPVYVPDPAEVAALRPDPAAERAAAEAAEAAEAARRAEEEAARQAEAEAAEAARRAAEEAELRRRAEQMATAALRADAEAEARREAEARAAEEARRVAEEAARRAADEAARRAADEVARRAADEEARRVAGRRRGGRRTKRRGARRTSGAARDGRRGAARGGRRGAARGGRRSAARGGRRGAAGGGRRGAAGGGRRGAAGGGRRGASGRRGGRARAAREAERRAAEDAARREAEVRRAAARRAAEAAAREEARREAERAAQREAAIRAAEAAEAQARQDAEAAAEAEARREAEALREAEAREQAEARRAVEARREAEAREQAEARQAEAREQAERASRPRRASRPSGGAPPRRPSGGGGAGAAGGRGRGAA